MRRGVLAIVAVCALGVLALPSAASAKACDQIGVTDPTSFPNATYAPRLDQTLVPRRADGRLPLGFADNGIRSSLFRQKRLDMEKRAGGTLVRYDVRWDAMQPTENGAIDWTEPDGAYCAAVANGVAPVLVLVGVPQWVSGCSSPCAMPPDAAHLETLRQFAFRVAARYPQAAAVEAWNEPNFVASFTPGTPAAYEPVLEAIYNGVKNGDAGHDMPVLGGALGLGGGAGTMTQADFLSGMYTAGAASFMDAISFHVYADQQGQYTPRQVIQQFEVPQLKAAIPPAERGHRRLWITEAGTHYNAPGTDQDTNLYGAYLDRNGDPDFDAMLFYTLLNQGPYQDYTEFGWVSNTNNSTFLPRPVYCDFAGHFGPPGPCGGPL